MSYGYNRVKDLDYGLDRYKSCDDLMVDTYGTHYFCEKYSERLGSTRVESEVTQIVFFCGHINEHNKCRIDMRKQVERENAEKKAQERVAKEKAETEQIIANYASAIKNNPDDAQTYERRGFDFVMKGYMDRGIADYSKAIQLKPDNTETYRWRGMAYSQKAETNRLNGMESSQIKEYDNAIEDFNTVLKHTPNDAEARSFRGFAYSQKNDYDKAIADFNEAIQRDPKCKNAYVGLGVIYNEKGKLDLSIENYKIALQIEPNDNFTASVLEKVIESKKEKTKNKFWLIFSIVSGGIVSLLINSFVSLGITIPVLILAGAILGGILVGGFGFVVLGGIIGLITSGLIKGLHPYFLPFPFFLSIFVIKVIAFIVGASAGLLIRHLAKNK